MVSHLRGRRLRPHSLRMGPFGAPHRRRSAVVRRRGVQRRPARLFRIGSCGDRGLSRGVDPVVCQLPLVGPRLGPEAGQGSPPSPRRPRRRQLLHPLSPRDVALPPHAVVPPRLPVPDVGLDHPAPPRLLLLARHRQGPRQMRGALVCGGDNVHRQRGGVVAWACGAHRRRPSRL